MIQTVITMIIVFGALVLGYYSARDCRSKEGKFLSWAACLFIATASTCLISVFTGVLGDDIEIARQPRHQEIVSIRDESGVSGSFRMLQSHDYYFMFGKTQRGNLERVKLPSQSCEIIQTDKESPKIKWEVVTYRPSYFYHIWPERLNQANTKYDIIVPANTVIEQFKLQ